MVVNIAQHVYALYENKIKKFACKWKKKDYSKKLQFPKQQPFNWNSWYDLLLS
jgi:hypothetical protein